MREVATRNDRFKTLGTKTSIDIEKISEEIFQAYKQHARKFPLNFKLTHG